MRRFETFACKAYFYYHMACARSMNRVLINGLRKWTFFVSLYNTLDVLEIEGKDWLVM